LSNHERVKIGCVIVNGNWMISSGYNQAKSHPRQFRANALVRRVALQSHLHAEIDALIKTRRTDLTGSEAFIFRTNRNGDLAMCRPCRACYKALKTAGISTITYTTHDGVECEQIM
jgi:deoxycytidylate deaminase